jgi:D-alanyl-lipoteichoic acid acyltransferase DltB (MBOAT superfamily)
VNNSETGSLSLVPLGFSFFIFQFLPILLVLAVRYNMDRRDTTDWRNKRVLYALTFLNYLSFSLLAKSGSITEKAKTAHPSVKTLSFCPASTPSISSRWDPTPPDQIALSVYTA